MEYPEREHTVTIHPTKDNVQCDYKKKHIQNNTLPIQSANNDTKFECEQKYMNIYIKSDILSKTLNNLILCLIVASLILAGHLCMKKFGCTKSDKCGSGKILPCSLNICKNLNSCVNVTKVYVEEG